MKDLLDRLSSYNFFNNLLPGALFAVIATRYTSATLTSKDLLLAFFIYYFIGLVVSRIGSLIVEPVLIKLGVVSYSDYSKFVSASKSDQKLNTLVEANNTYRTMIALFLCLAAFKSFDVLAIKVPAIGGFAPYALSAFLIFLFIWSFKKQSGYINKRVDCHEESPKD